MSTESEDHPDQNQEPTSQADRGTYTPILDQPRRKKGSRARPTYLHEQTRRRKPRPAEGEIKSKPGNENKPPKIVRQKGPKPFARNIVDGYEEKLLESLVPPIIPTPPPETIPTFIGPEFRRLEHPEELSHEGLPKRRGDAGNKPSHQRQRRRWNEKNDGDYGGRENRMCTTRIIAISSQAHRKEKYLVERAVCKRQRKANLSRLVKNRQGRIVLCKIKQIPEEGKDERLLRMQHM
jgi:hypothetical protein